MFGRRTGLHTYTNSRLKMYCDRNHFLNYYLNCSPNHVPSIISLVPSNSLGYQLSFYVLYKANQAQIVIVYPWFPFLIKSLLAFRIIETHEFQSLLAMTQSCLDLILLAFYGAASIAFLAFLNFFFNSSFLKKIF